MGWLSTYNQSFSAPNGIDGKTLKEKFIEDGLLVKNAENKYEFDPAKLNGTRGSCMYDFSRKQDDRYVSDCFSEDGNTLSCYFNSDSHGDDFLAFQEKSMKKISKVYPDTTFSMHASYCPGGCGFRTTAFDGYVTNGESTDSKGVACEDSMLVPKKWFSKSNEPDKVNYKFFRPEWADNVGSFDIPKSDLEVEGEDYVRLYIRKDSDPMIEDVMIDCQAHDRDLIKKAEEAEYRAMMGDDYEESNYECDGV